MAYTLITGASAGIGETFARKLAKSGNDLILVARRKEKLDSLAQALRNAHGIQVQVITADLAVASGAANVASQVQEAGWPVEGLINNAGFGDRGSFMDLALERQMQMIQLNVSSLVELTHRLLPLMVQQSSPWIINVASLAAFQAGPNMATYYATKAFVLSFSEALTEELRGRVNVSALCPGATESEFAENADMTGSKLFSMGTMTAEAVVDEALEKRQQAIIIAGMKNKMTVLSTKLTPRAITRKLAGWLQS